MPSPIVSSAFIRLMDARLSKVEENQYTELTSMIGEFYNEMSTEKQWEEYFSVGSLPDIPEFTGKVSYLSLAPGFHTKIEPKEYSGGVQVERKFLDDKMYGVFDNRAASLVRSAHRTKEKLGVRAFSNAFSTAFDFQESEEGTSLCSSSHLTKSGTSTATGFDNAGTTALSKTSVAATRLLMRGFRNDISERIEMSDDLALIVPDALADTAHEIMGTKSGLDTGDGNINVQYQRHSVIPYMRLDDYDTNNWFMVDKAKMKESLLWLNRISDDINHTFDFETYMTKVSLYFRVAYGWKDWRWIYGHAVA